MSPTRRRLPFICAALLLASAIGMSCSDMGDPVEPAPPAPVSFSADIQPIFSARCAVSGCHVGPTPEGGCDLSEGVSYSEIVNVRAQTFPGQRVTPGSPNGSVLYLLVEGGSMPAIGGSLTESQVELIRSWIAAGALEN